MNRALTITLAALLSSFSACSGRCASGDTASETAAGGDPTAALGSYGSRGSSYFPQPAAPPPEEPAPQPEAIPTGSHFTTKRYTTLPYRGLSLAGAEFGASIGGTFDGNTLGTVPGSYYYPDVDWPDDRYPGGYGNTAYPFLREHGFNTVRLPFRWERLQRGLNAEFDAVELGRLKRTVADLTDAGFTVILDLHNYGRYGLPEQIPIGEIASVVGSKKVPHAAFADLWSRLATLYKDQNNVVFGLMNEPFGYDEKSWWLTSANQAIAAIRATGAKNLVLVGGNEFSDAFNWVQFSGYLSGLKDPLRNFAFEVHSYVDKNKNGSENTCPDVNVGPAQLKPFTDWARKHRVRGFLGEFSGGTNVHAEPACSTAMDNEIKYLEQNSDVYIGWTFWAGGQGWGTENVIENSILTKKDAPQLKVLLEHMK